MAIVFQESTTFVFETWSLPGLDKVAWAGWSVSFRKLQALGYVCSRIGLMSSRFGGADFTN